MERIYTIALQRLLFNYPDTAILLYRECGGAEEVYVHRNEIKEILPDATETLIKLITTDWSNTLRWAEEETRRCQQKNISILTPPDEAYPQRLHECHDAPLALFYTGHGNLNAKHMLSIVGTRQSTAYGRDVIQKILTPLREEFPDLLIVSGLAYGIDVESHRCALALGLPTVGVMAHGLDTIYPASHRNTAAQMTVNGGILTEYPLFTRADKQNFLRRNRIVAGMGEATLVIESKVHGGSLVTARLAVDYGREVFAAPGRIGDSSSEGCNALIRDNKAQMLTSADDIIKALGWYRENMYHNTLRKEGIQTSFVQNLGDDEQAVVTALHEGDITIEEISRKTGITVKVLSALLFEMEMKGIVRPLPGNRIHLT